MSMVIDGIVPGKEKAQGHSFLPLFICFYYVKKEMTRRKQM